MDDELEGMLLFSEKDIPFPKSLWNEVRMWKTLWQSKDWELPNNLLLALGACDEDAFPNIPQGHTTIVFCKMSVRRVILEDG